MERVQHSHAEIDGELQPRLTRSGLDPLLLLEQEDAKAVEAGVLERESIFGFVHAEAARAAGAGGEKDIAVDDVLARHSLLFQALKVLDQVSDGEIRGIALAVISELLAGLERGHVRSGDDLAFISAAFENGLDESFMLPRQTAEQDGDVVTLLGAEGPLHRFLEVLKLHQSCLNHQPRALGAKSLENIGFACGRHIDSLLAC